MKKFIISLGGRGGEYFLFPLSEEQREKASILDLKNTDYESILDLLDVGDVMDTEESYLGAFYDPELFSIMVTPENDMENVVWVAEDDHSFEDEEYVDVTKTNHLVVEDYVKGTFFTFEVECEEFDSTKLVPIVTVIDDFELITSFKYDGKDLTDTRQYYDYWSKGFSYYLIKD